MKKIISVSVLFVMIIMATGCQLFKSTDQKEETANQTQAYSDENYSFEYPQNYQIKKESEPDRMEVSGEDGRLSIFQLKSPSGERVTAFGFGQDNEAPQKMETIENEQTWFNVWMYYNADDKETENELITIFNSIKLNATEWTEYKDAENGFKISYPAGWRIVKENTFIGFGPKEIHEDVAWAVSFYEKDKYDIEKIISDIGDQFNPDRNETRETISLKDVRSNIIEATLVTVTTSKHPDWYSQTVIIQGENTIYKISNGASKDEKFKYFYESFQQL